MRNSTLALFAILFITISGIISCKKSTKAPTANSNTPHSLSNKYYIRALLDTTWIYAGNDNADECQYSGSLCSSFLIFGNNYQTWAEQINLTDSAHSGPRDSVILGWAGKTFVTAGDNSVPHPYLFSFYCPDSVGHALSSNYVVVNTGAMMQINSVVYNGLSPDETDSAGNPLKFFKINGTFNCKVTHFGDTTTHTLTQGVFCINVVESK